MSQDHPIDEPDAPAWTNAALYGTDGEVVAIVPIDSPAPDVLEHAGVAYVNTGAGTDSTGGGVLRYDPRDG